MIKQTKNIIMLVICVLCFCGTVSAQKLSMVQLSNLSVNPLYNVHKTTRELDTTVFSVAASFTIDTIALADQIVWCFGTTEGGCEIDSLVYTLYKKADQYCYKNDLGTEVILTSPIYVPLYHVINWQQWKRTAYITLRVRDKKRMISNTLVYKKS